MNVSDLRTSVDGAVFVPDAAGFDAERPGLNRAVPQQPAVIVGAQQIHERLATLHATDDRRNLFHADLDIPPRPARQPRRADRQ
jgi:hypothetical protein